MSILFVLLTFLLILTVMYFRRPQEGANALQVAPGKKPSPLIMLKKVAIRVLLGARASCDQIQSHPASDHGRKCIELLNERSRI